MQHLAHVFKNYQAIGVTTKQRKEKELRDELKKLAD
jgi:hypothetical protein